MRPRERSYSKWIQYKIKYNHQMTKVYKQYSSSAQVKDAVLFTPCQRQLLSFYVETAGNHAQISPVCLCKKKNLCACGNVVSSLMYSWTRRGESRGSTPAVRVLHGVRGPHTPTPFYTLVHTPTHPYTLLHTRTHAHTPLHTLKPSNTLQTSSTK